MKKISKIPHNKLKFATFLRLTFIGKPQKALGAVAIHLGGFFNL